ncbi:hypothetical protein RJ639_008890 [Escallonia herrerae]|uniref:Integrase catalytic domain-containing protein n=1 Tax=Escallonia herrerae TaxID=1293975 RepID=A0AA88VUD2_9ASTE|nr:hypothetical protein RJ639_008890 [Escallonia herrerae]
MNAWQRFSEVAFGLFDSIFVLTTEAWAEVFFGPIATDLDLCLSSLFPERAQKSVEADNLATSAWRLREPDESEAQEVVDGDGDEIGGSKTRTMPCQQISAFCFGVGVSSEFLSCTAMSLIVKSALPVAAKSFEELKTYLSSPPLLSKPLPGEDLFLYLSIIEVAVSAVLVRGEDGLQKPIYYVSKVLQDVETRYSKIDKIALALIISARHLRPYFQSHTIFVLTDQPLRKVLLSLEALGRLVNWSVELWEFNIQYKPRTAIKAQALADFIVECTLPKDPPQLVISEVPDPWNLYVDGSSAIGSSGARIILISPKDYFTKWTEAESLATITSAKCEDFFWKNVICCFGVPKALVVDNGKQFDNNNFRTFCTNLSIDLRFTSVAHPQSNGQTENMNRNILQGLKKKLDEAKGAWVDELPKVLWAYRTTPYSVTGETPFLLCYGT